MSSPNFPESESIDTMVSVNVLIKKKLHQEELNITTIKILKNITFFAMQKSGKGLARGSVVKSPGCPSSGSASFPSMVRSTGCPSSGSASFPSTQSTQRHFQCPLQRPLLAPRGLQTPCAANTFIQVAPTKKAKYFKAFLKLLFYRYKRGQTGAGGRAHWTRSPVALPKDPCNSCTHIRQLTTAYSSSSRGIKCLFLSGHPHSSAHAHTKIQTYMSLKVKINRWAW